MSVSELFTNYFQSPVQAGLTSALVASGIGFVIIPRVRAHFAVRNFNRLQLLGDECVYGQTNYLDTGILNPETGEEFVDQELVTINKSVRLSQIFGDKAALSMAKYFDQARKQCSGDRPVLFEHLQGIVKRKNSDAVERIVAPSWVSYFSKVLLADAPQVPNNLGARQRAEKKTMLPLPVYEPNTRVKRYRILLVDPARADELPDAANIRCMGPVVLEKDEGGNPMYRRKYIRDENHSHMQRLDTMRAISETLKRMPELIDTFGVDVPTGRIIDVPQPIPTQERDL